MSALLMVHNSNAKQTRAYPTEHAKSNFQETGWDYAELGLWPGLHV